MDVLLSPVILFFILGALAAAARSDLSIPEPIAKGLALYLMMAIGLKGGVEVSQIGLSWLMVAAAAVGVGLSILIPFHVFWWLRTAGGLDRTNAAAVAAHYGSVSVVTFVAASELLTASGRPPAGFMIAVLALMETPAIIVGLYLAQAEKESPGHRSEMVRETLLNGTVVLLLGSFIIGAIVGKSGFAPLAPVFEAGFRGALCLFLLDMGLIAVRRLRDSRALTWRLGVLRVAMPIVHGIAGVLLGASIGLDTGSTAALGVLAASASYIAVPAAMRMALPQADPGVSLAMSLAVTFPFNILVGIPTFLWLATWMARS